jgi:hypothetical protein
MPLGAQVDVAKFKAVLFDIGIHQRLLGLDVPEYLTSSDLELVNRGSVAEVFTGLELVGNHPAHTRPTLHYWHREARGSNANRSPGAPAYTSILPCPPRLADKHSYYIRWLPRSLAGMHGARPRSTHIIRVRRTAGHVPPGTLPRLRGRIPAAQTAMNTPLTSQKS